MRKENGRRGSRGKSGADYIIKVRNRRVILINFYFNS